VDDARQVARHHPAGDAAEHRPLEAVGEGDDLVAAVEVPALAACLALAAIARGEGRAFAAELRPNRWFFAIGAGVAAMTMLHFAAMSLTHVASVVAVKRSSLVASVIIGRVFFGERGLRRRLPGAALMLAGVALLALAD
jgi:uncharacterized membrane protein